MTISYFIQQLPEPEPLSEPVELPEPEESPDDDEPFPDEELPPDDEPEPLPLPEEEPPAISSPLELPPSLHPANESTRTIAANAAEILANFLINSLPKINIAEKKFSTISIVSPPRICQVL